MLLSPISRLPGGLRGVNFYHPKVGFGSVTEGYAESNAHCTIVEFPDLEGVSRIDKNHTALSDEVAAEIVRDAVEVVLPHVA